MIEVASSLIIFKSLQRLYIAAIICRLTKLRCRAPWCAIKIYITLSRYTRNSTDARNRLHFISRINPFSLPPGLVKEVYAIWNTRIESTPKNRVLNYPFCSLKPGIIILMSSDTLCFLISWISWNRNGCLIVSRNFWRVQKLLIILERN